MNDNKKRDALFETISEAIDRCLIENSALIAARIADLMVDYLDEAKSK